MPFAAPRSRDDRHGRTRPRTTLLLAIVLVLGAGCGGNGTTSSAPADASAGGTDGLPEYDPAGDALLAQLDLVETTVVAARDALRRAAGATEAADVAAALADARGLLLAESVRVDGPTALLPATASARDATDARPEDLLTATATLAGDDTSSRARTVLELLRDPIAGDLGAWLRDPEGVVGLIVEVAASALDAVGPEGEGDLGAADAAVRTLDGEATRALAWTLAATDALGSGRPEVASELAARGAAHLEVVRVGIGLARSALLEAATTGATGGTPLEPEDDAGSPTRADA